MATSESNTRYHILPPRISEDTDRESSSNDRLLPISDMDVPKFHHGYSITFNLVIMLQSISSILAFTAFMLLVISGHPGFIAADIFLMFIIILNIFTTLHHFLSSTLKVTVEFRQQPINRDSGSFKKPNVSSYFDLGLSVCLMLCLVIGCATRRCWSAEEIVASVFGYLVIGIQVLLAIPSLDQTNLSLMASVKPKGQWETHTPDTKLPAVANVTDNGSTQRQFTGNEEPSQSAGDLV